MAASWIILCSVLVICREGWIPARLVEETCKLTSMLSFKIYAWITHLWQVLKIVVFAAVYLLPGQLFSLVLG